MNENLREKAKTLAARPYLIRIVRDDSEPEEVLFVALNPELEGCVAQGLSVEEAEANLDEFRIDYIEHLLEHNLPVPDPATTPVTITGNLERGAVIRYKLEDSTMSPIEGDESRPDESERLVIGA